MNLDKFYTSKETAIFCFDKLLEVIKEYDIVVSEFIEPSAGSGSFSNLVECIAYDIEPEAKNIIKADFLELDIGYKEGRVIFGNPPFGKRNNLSRSFYKKSCKISDVIGFILPISQLNNSESLYDFDLVKSIDLGILEYSKMKIHCCFNIFIRPKNGLNKRVKRKSDLITIYREDEKGYDGIEYDFAICRRGSFYGKERLINLHTQTYKIKVHDKGKVEEVKQKILEFDWKGYKIHQSAPSISKADIIKLLGNIK